MAATPQRVPGSIAAPALQRRFTCTAASPGSASDAIPASRPRDVAMWRCGDVATATPLFLLFGIAPHPFAGLDHRN
jgi:hypothetical protein